MNKIDWVTWGILFFVYFLFDILYAQYVIAISKLKPFLSSFISVLMYMLTAYGTIKYVECWINVFPIVCGAWLGTFLTIKYEILKKNKK